MAKSRDKIKERRWQQLIREKRASGQSVAVFCRVRRIPEHQFYWWQRQLRLRHGSQSSGATQTDDPFLPVRVPFQVPMMELVHPGGCVIRIGAGVDTRSLRRVLDALQQTEQ